MYFFIEKYKISHQMVTFPWKELPDFHIFSHHGGGGEFGGASVSIARLHTWHKGCLSGTCALSEAENFVFLKRKFLWGI